MHGERKDRGRNQKILHFPLLPKLLSEHAKHGGAGLKQRAHGGLLGTPSDEDALNADHDAGHGCLLLRRKRGRRVVAAQDGAQQRQPARESVRLLLIEGFAENAPSCVNRIKQADVLLTEIEVEEGAALFSKQDVAGVGITVDQLAG